MSEHGKFVEPKSVNPHTNAIIFFRALERDRNGQCLIQFAIASNGECFSLG